VDYDSTERAVKTKTCKILVTHLVMYFVGYATIAEKSKHTNSPKVCSGFSNHLNYRLSGWRVSRYSESMKAGAQIQ